MTTGFYYLLLEEDQVRIATAYDPEWLKAIDAGILEVFRVVSPPDYLHYNGLWKLYSGPTGMTG